ncbi:MAG: ABC transporter ATP-binding protein [Thermotogaceae bacterium]|jgi:branched-chain amino acid transport system ATP-binding protein|nr:ABC transporter ATP-binding protein [Thermotogota bacterium]NLZ14050.1 ABC transporter ATP-binding protein [Thermotogaceae bacterium]MDD8040568.1 ABC transporter ATP-binding protein [Thermotogota bacterium]HOZ11484.1 ABC transporter ATP-binding protein [Thermotogota bacterium]HPB86671.1 ABC transporter ATP-binding protein [Thermotogota bacterium]
MLELKGVKLKYGYVEALKGIDMHVKEHQITALLGANGAGKSTTLRAVSCLNRIEKGEITFLDQIVHRLQPSEIVHKGIVHCPEGRKLFPFLTVQENLLAGAYTLKDRNQIRSLQENVFTLFPILKDRRKQMAGTLSGGEQQMLAIGRALMAAPKILMLDEPSLGLAPKIVEQIFDTLVTLREEGTTIFLVEQNANAALHIADYAYILEVGKVVLEGEGNALLKNENVKKKYLGG